MLFIKGNSISNQTITFHSSQIILRMPIKYSNHIFRILQYSINDFYEKKFRNNGKYFIINSKFQVTIFHLIHAESRYTILNFYFIILFRKKGAQFNVISAWKNLS